MTLKVLLAAGLAVALAYGARALFRRFLTRRLAELVAGDARPRISALMKKRYDRGRTVFGRIGRGLWVHIIPLEVDPERGLRLGRLLPVQEADGKPLFQMRLSDLAAADHPAAEGFEPAVGVEPGTLDPERVVFTIVPDRVREVVIERLTRAGLKPVASDEDDSPLAPLKVTYESVPTVVDLNDLIAECLGTVTPAEVLAEDRAIAARGRASAVLSTWDWIEEMDAALVVQRAGDALEVRDPDDGSVLSLPLRGLAAWVGPRGVGLQRPDNRADGDAPLTRRVRPLSVLDDEELCTFDRGGWAEIVVRETPSGPVPLPPEDTDARDREALAARTEADLALSHFYGWCVAPRSDQIPTAATLVGPDIVSVAWHPRLLSAAAEATGRFAAGDRVRVRATETHVLVIAEPRADEVFLAAARRAGRRISQALDLSPGGEVSLDLTLELPDSARGEVALMPVTGRFFSASARERISRATGDLAGAAESRGIQSALLGDAAGARAHLETALECDPDNADLLQAVGTLQNDLGAHAAAEVALSRAIELGASDATLVNNLGVALQGLGRDEEAAARFEEAIELDPENAVVHLNLGRLYLEHGDADEAEDAFRRALDLDPNLIEGHTGLIAVAVRTGNTELARRRLARALSVAPTDDSLLRLQVMLSESQGFQ